MTKELNYCNSSVLILLLVWLFIAPNPLRSQWIYSGLSGGINTLAASGSNLFAGSRGSVYLSTNNGVSWNSVSGGLPGNHDITSIVISGTNIFAGSDAYGVFRSTNNGSNWIAVNNGLTTLYVNSLLVFDNSLYAATNLTAGGGIFRSTNNGTNWTTASNGLPFNSFISFQILGTDIFVGSLGSGVFRSTNGGTSWLAAGLSNYWVYSFAVSDINLFAGAPNSGIFRTTNYGTNWVYTSNGLPTYPGIYAMTSVGKNIFAAVYDSGVFRSTNNGKDWESINTGLPKNSSFICFLIYNGFLFAGTQMESVWKRPLSEIISVQTLSTEVPANFRLEQNYPNPFNPVTNISFKLPSRAFVSLKIFDAAGKEVASLISEELGAGSFVTQWDATGNTSGFYFYRFQAGLFDETKKLILLK